MRTTLATIAAVLSVLPAAAQQYTFEGSVDYQMQKDATMTYSSGQGMVRLDIAGQRGSMATLIDPAKRTLTVMMSAQKMYMVRPMPEIGSGSDSSAKLTNTGKTDVVAGVKCEIWTGQGEHGTFTVCAARDMGSFFAGMGGRREAPEWAKELRGNFFPLRVVNGQGETVMLATKVERKKLDKSLFTVPADFTKMEMPAGMGAPPPGR
jgi:hypothetical protein